MNMRKIIHIDMDAFYASIEQRDNVDYRGKPLAVGYSGNRGVVAAASYEARRYGVRSAMASKVALRKCPHLIFVPARFDVYKSVSRQIMEIFHEYTDLVEPLSLDEAFLDVTENHKNISSATQIAQEIKDRIHEATQLTASAGVSFNKFLAKIASDYNKPNGLFVIKPKIAERFVESLAIEQFFGVGKVTAERMHQLGIKTGMDLKQHSEQELVSYFGKAGHIYYQNARGEDDRPVESHRVRKSIGAEITFEGDIDDFDELCLELDEVAKDVIERISKRGFKGRTVTLKIKFADFKTISRSKTQLDFVTDFDTLYKTGVDLLKNVDITPKVRLIGLTIKNNDEEIWSEAIQLRIKFDED
ncbi:DNA polymerase IV [Dysgonomonas sp. ZJ709]|uniref:DNA polymerase IV n=1 Tax=Dysgonomonas sp. ZJ709 TaxID=2709797 RepID=UPI0013EBD2E2|nr:DNA polymerase IV [Dysgonomonas sp. ZJ709]